MAESQTFGTCSNFGPYRVNVPTPYPMGKFKGKFDTAKPIRVAMFSQPLLLFSGAWPADDTVSLTIPLAGHHKFIVFGTGPDGAPVFEGCETDSTETPPVSVQNATLTNNSNSSPDATTGSNSSQWVGAGGVMVLLGGLLWIAAARRRRDQPAAS